MRRFFLVMLVFMFTLAQSQDTIRMMHYNLLNYGNYYGSCTGSNNNVFDKNEYLNTIIDYIQPDIFTVNEINDNLYYHDLILDEVMNTNGSNTFSRADLPNYSSSFIMNQVYYNTEKILLNSVTAIETNYRDIDILKFIHTPLSGGNIELNCAVAHLKAGTGWEDERLAEVNLLMSYLNNSSAQGNYTFSGDFNLYTAAEPAYQSLLYHPNNDIRFYDPVNQQGSWHNNSYYASVHTQSTHTEGSCHAGGGLDDRFDFILISDEIRDGTDGIKYLEDSYKAIGQDGMHFNKSLIDWPNNTTVPSDVLNALYYMSDHLPVILDLVVGDNTGNTNEFESKYNVVVQNPANESIFIRNLSGEPVFLTFELYNMLGRLCIQNKFPMGPGETRNIPAISCHNGLYTLKLADSDGISKIFKIIIRK